MTLDNGSTNGQSDSHTIILCGIERFEESIRRLRLKADSQIFDADAHPIPFISFSSNQQLPRAIIDGAHRVRSVAEQIQNDLLKLNAITSDRREIIAKFGP
jgi:hypothetical protein